MKLRQSLSIFVLLMLLSGCITVRFYDGENDSKWLEVNPLPGVTEVNSLPAVTEATTTIYPSRTIAPTESKLYGPSQPALKPGTWYFVAVTRQGRTITMYLDGHVASSADFDPLNLDAPISLKIGRREGDQGFYLDGRIDEVEIYKGLALTPGQIFALYSAGSLGKCKGYVSSPCLPPLVGLTGWWPGDGNSEDIVNSRNGKFLAGATTGPGLVDRAFVLDGENDYIEIPDDPALNFGTRDFTIDLWVYFNHLSSEQVLIEKWDQGDPVKHAFSQGWTLTKLANQALLFAMDDGSGGDWGISLEPRPYATATSTILPSVLPTISPSTAIIPTDSKIVQIQQPAIKPGTWYFIAVTRQGRTMTMYIDGRVASSGDFVPLNLDAAISLKFGRREGEQGMYFHGRIDEVEIYNGTALTAGQISQLYSAGSYGKCSGGSRTGCVSPPAGLTGWWPGDGGAGDIVSQRNGFFTEDATTGPGLVGDAFVFDGDGDYIEVPDNPALNFGTGDFTVDLWVNFDDLSGSQILVEKWIQAEAREHTISQGWTLQKVDNWISIVMEDGSTEESIGIPFVPGSTAASTITPTAIPTATPVKTISQTPVPPASKPPGIIVFVCEIFLDKNTAQICMMNADGSNYHRLTTDNSIQYQDPRIDPHGKFVIFSALKAGNFQLFKMDLDGLNYTQQLTFDKGDSRSPSISQDGTLIAYTFTQGDNDSIRIFDRRTSKSWQIYGPPVGSGWNPIWSPDATRIMFLAKMDTYIQLFVIDINGLNYRRISDLPSYHEVFDWSPDGKQIAMAVGKPWERAIYIFNVDASLRIPPLADSDEIVPSMSTEGKWIANNLYPGFSPDGQWITYTAYTAKYNYNSCEIFVYNLQTGENLRLTDNIYCDYDADWGP